MRVLFYYLEDSGLETGEQVHKTTTKTATPAVLTLLCVRAHTTLPGHLLSVGSHASTLSFGLNSTLISSMFILGKRECTQVCKTEKLTSTLRSSSGRWPLLEILPPVTLCSGLWPIPGCCHQPAAAQAGQGFICDCSVFCRFGSFSRRSRQTSYATCSSSTVL